MNLSTVNATDNNMGCRPNPATSAAQYEILASAISTLMLVGGIETIKVERRVAGAASTLLASIAPFPEAPREIQEQGAVIKDAIAQIMAIAGVPGYVLTLEAEEMTNVVNGWKAAVDQARAANEGSNQVAPKGGSGEGSGSGD